MPRITLFTYWRSSSSYRVRIALNYKGVAYDAVAVNLLMDEQNGALHRARSPFGVVPAIDIDGQTCVESVAIVELLDELYPSPPLYPRDPWGRARVRALVELVNAGTQPLQNLAVLKHLSPDKSAREAWGRHFIGKGLAAFEALMAQHHAAGVRGSYAHGSELSAADLFLVPQLYNARRFSVDLALFPRVVAAVDAASAHAAFAAAAPDRQADALRDAT